MECCMFFMRLQQHAGSDALLEQFELAGIWGAKAARAYEYAKQMWKKHGDKATCTNSVAKDNCIGSGCTKTFDGAGVRGVRTTLKMCVYCDVYRL